MLPAQPDLLKVGKGKAAREESIIGLVYLLLQYQGQQRTGRTFPETQEVNKFEHSFPIPSLVLVTISFQLKCPCGS